MSHSMDLVTTIRKTYENSLYQWEQTQSEWRDQKAERFANSYWNYIDSGLNEALQLLEQAQTIIEGSKRIIPEV